jgi:hypothetical protein
MGSRCTGAGGRNKGWYINIRFDFKEINPWVEREVFSIISCEIRRLCTGGMDAIYPTMRAKRGFHLYLAEIAMTAGYSSAPENLIAHSKRHSIDIFLFSLQLRDLSHPFVAENHREADARVPSFPLMDI